MNQSIRDNGIDLDRPVLICGVGRSGTSLLHSMMNAHPELCFPPETHFFRRYVARGRLGPDWDEAQRLRLLAHLQADEDFGRVGIAPEQLLADRLADEGPAGVFRALLREVAQRASKSRVGDKDPKNIDSLHALHAAFPDAYVIHVIRDPRDVLLSRMRAAWSASRPWWMHPLIYREQIKRGKRHGRELFGERYLELRYEDLISDAEAQLRRVCEHVDLEFDLAMLSFGESAAELVDAKEMSWKRETLGPLLSANTGKWRGTLSPAQVAYCEEICREAFLEHDYERSLPARTLLHLLATGLHDASSLVYDMKTRRSA